ncbi:amidohydrolase family protein [Planctobacterium marinum]|uniref:Amidohydrolase-related domain-containing protein n=1 Tax=Planctobacterium marinum TaxID=1631968 RepID=A0AA48KNC5_9ALTE|nr:hypothetical protein MACH26_08770 [Planctobacterium marinum]
MLKFFLYGVLLSVFSVQASTTTFKNGFYLNPETKQIEPISFKVQDGFITSLQEVKERPAQQVIDLQGKLVVPGMIDMHTHGWGNASLRNNDDYQYIGLRGTANAMLYAGVHGWLDLFNDEVQILNYRDQHHSRHRQESEVFAAGPCFTASGGHCSQFGTPTRIIDSPADVEKEVSALAIRKPNVLKVVYHTKSDAPTIDKPTLKAFLAKAKQLNIPSAVHVGNWDDVRTAAEFGADAVTHLPWSAMPADIAVLMSENHTAIIPTVGLLAELKLLQKSAHLPDYAARLTKALVVDELTSQFPIEGKNRDYLAWLNKYPEAMTHMANSLLTLHAEGVKIMIGSDAGNEAMYQGVGFHREMAHLQAMGIPANELLLAASNNAYQFLGLNWGLKPGAPAHFSVFDKRLLEDISMSHNVQTIYSYGKEVQRAGLLQFAKPGWWQYSQLFLGFED